MRKAPTGIALIQMYAQHVRANTSDVLYLLKRVHFARELIRKHQVILDSDNCIIIL